MTDGRALVRAERDDFADFLESLTEEQWDVQSLSSEWRVRDVADHVIGTTELRISPKVVLATARCGFSVNRMIARDGIERGRRDPSDLVAGVRAVASSHHLPPGVKHSEGMLMDAVLHHQDVRRPLGLVRHIPEERPLAVLDELKGYRPPGVNARCRVTGLRLTATDLDWSAGDGPEVSGPGEALALVMAGRRAALDDLVGEGTEILAGRL